MINYAPIVLFVYNRPEHARKTLEALQKNHLSEDSILYIYSDGAKDKATPVELKSIEHTRNVIRKEKWCGEVHIIESESNIGLAKSIVNGVTEVVERYGSVIVLEDDIVTSSGFLTYMNDALNFYQDKEEVMHISGYMYPHNSILPESFFYNVTLCWGWATWKESWSCYNNDAVTLWKEISRKNLFNKLDKFGGTYLSAQLGHNITGKLDTWFVKWHASVLLENGYTLFPGESMVNNIGFDNTGVHNGSFDEFENFIIKEKVEVTKINFIENKKAGIVMIDFYNQLNGDLVFKKKSWWVNQKLRNFIKKKLRNYFIKIFPNVRDRNVSEDCCSNTFQGINSKVYSSCRLHNSIVGDYTYIAENSIINNTIIGKFCSIGPNLISGWGIHPTHGISTHPMFYSTMKQNGMTLSLTNKVEDQLPIEIGNDVFIGMNVTILDGIKIGDGAVIGAGAVVSKNIPPYAVAVGTPIQIIKYRFDEEVIKSLLKIKWWEFNLEELKNIEKDIFNIDNFLDKQLIQDQ